MLISEQYHAVITCLQALPRNNSEHNNKYETRDWFYYETATTVTIKINWSYNEIQYAEQGSANQCD